MTLCSSIDSNCAKAFFDRGVCSGLRKVNGEDREDISRFELEQKLMLTTELINNGQNSAVHAGVAWLRPGDQRPLQARTTLARNFRIHGVGLIFQTPEGRIDLWGFASLLFKGLIKCLGRKEMVPQGSD